MHGRQTDMDGKYFRQIYTRYLKGRKMIPLLVIVFIVGVVVGLILAGIIGILVG